MIEIAAPDSTRPGAVQLLDKYDTAIDLEFARTPSGTVHVIVPEAPDWARPAARVLERWSDAADIVTDRTPMVCGLRRLLNPFGDRGTVPVDVFADDDLCERCVKGLGRHSARAFEHPQPEDTDGEEISRS